MKTATFRHLRGLSRVARAWSGSLMNLKIVYKAYEEPVGSAAKLDAGLTQLDAFSHDTRVDLEIQGLNLLVPNQMDSLPLVGSRINKVTLVQGQFLHPQALNPWAKHCPDLKALEVVGCGSITDDMFVGEVPQLMSHPFQG